MPKIQDVLKKAGYTDEELKGMETLIANPKFASAIDGELAQIEALQADVTKKQQIIDGDTTWYNETCVPQTDKLVQAAADAQAKAAAAEARLNALAEAGVYKPTVVDPVVLDPKAKAGNDSNPDARYVTAEQFGKAYEGVGDAIEMAQDIVADHQDLFGKRLQGGIGALRKKYKEAVTSRMFNGSLREFWEKDNNVDARRTELQAEAAKKHDDAIRLEERTRLASERGNPMTSAMVPSRNPFTNRTVSADGKPLTDTQRPWEKPSEGRASDRVSKFSTKVLQQSVQ
jgi:hypothetical protein